MASMKTATTETKETKVTTFYQQHPVIFFPFRFMNFMAVKTDAVLQGVGIQTEYYYLRFMQFLTTLTMIVSDKMSKLSMHLPMPKFMGTYMENATRYFYNLNVDTKMAKDVWEVRDILVSDAKSQWEKIEMESNRMFHKYATIPPLCWMNLSQHCESTHQSDINATDKTTKYQKDETITTTNKRNTQQSTHNKYYSETVQGRPENQASHKKEETHHTKKITTTAENQGEHGQTH